jgi:hypothetical protein
MPDWGPLSPVDPPEPTLRQTLRGCLFIALWFAQFFGGLLIVHACQPAGSWDNSWRWWGSLLGTVITASTFGWLAKGETA